jgi:adenosine deaminase CECR1
MSAVAVLEMYNRQRLEFIQDDRSRRRDLTQHANVTNAEAIAERVFRDLRAAEAVAVWAAEHKDVPHPFPGMEFLTGLSCPFLSFSLELCALTILGITQESVSLSKRSYSS